MPCLLGCFAIIAPRTVIFIIWIFSDYLGRAYETILWPFLGFLFMPVTTLAYAWAMNSNGTVSGGSLVVLVLAILLELGIIGGSSRGRGQKKSR